MGRGMTLFVSHCVAFGVFAFAQEICAVITSLTTERDALLARRRRRCLKPVKREPVKREPM